MIDAQPDSSRTTRLPTAFSAALRELVARVHSARGAIFLDFEGMTIDEFASVTTMEIELAGAHLGIILSLLREREALIGATQEVIIEAQRAIYLIRAVDTRYLVVLEASPEAQVGLMSRELGRTVTRLLAQI